MSLLKNLNKYYECTARSYRKTTFNIPTFSRQLSRNRHRCRRRARHFFLAPVWQSRGEFYRQHCTNPRLHSKPKETDYEFCNTFAEVADWRSKTPLAGLTPRKKKKDHHSRTAKKLRDLARGFRKLTFRGQVRSSAPRILRRLSVIRQGNQSEYKPLQGLSSQTPVLSFRRGLPLSKVSEVRPTRTISVHESLQGITSPRTQFISRGLLPAAKALQEPELADDAESKQTTEGREPQLADDTENKQTTQIARRRQKAENHS